MRIATWNVNSLKARLEKVTWWLGRIQPDIILLQETKLTETDVVARAYFTKAGYEISQHGEGRWNGVAIASKVGLTDVIMNFGDVERVTKRKTASDNEPLAEARMISAVCGGIRIVCMYAPNGRIVGTPTYVAKLAWFDHLIRWIEETRRQDEALIVGGDMNVAPDERDVWDSKACHGGTHVTPAERERFARLLQWGLADSYRKHTDRGERYTWWDYRAGDFYKNFGMRIDHLLLSASVAERNIAAEIDREARKGKPTPSDHAPYIVDLDEPGAPFESGWEGADERIAERRAGKRR